MTKTGYIVAFRNLSRETGHTGIITWAEFNSKEQFAKFWKERDHSLEEIVEAGISCERAIELAKTTPIQAYINAAVMDSRNPNTGDFNLEIMRYKLDALRVMSWQRYAS